MLTLKDYQKRTLAALEDYLTHARMLGPKEAFTRYVAKNPTDVHPQVYRTRWNLNTVPDICLRLPTGGGKTLLAAHADNTKEKQNIGELWASKSGGKGVFMFVTEGDGVLGLEK